MNPDITVDGLWDDPPEVVPIAVPFTEFYMLARPKLVRGLALTLGDEDLAVDAADEALTRACLRWSQVSLLDNPAGWAFRVGLNWARSLMRRRRSARPLYDATVVDLPPMADPAIHAALRDLDVRQRSVVVCRFFLGWSEAETAAALGIRAGTVKSRQHRALTRLESVLSHLRPEES